MISEYGYELEHQKNSLRFLTTVEDTSVNQLMEEIGKIEGIALVSNIGFSEIVSVKVSRNGKFHLIFEDDASLSFPAK